MAEKTSRNRPPAWVIAWTVAAAVLLFLYLIRSILPPFVIGGIAAYVLSPEVDRIEQRWRLPHGVAIALLYLGLLAPLVALIIYFGPRFIQESRELLTQGPFIVTRLIEQVFGSGPYNLFGTATTSREIAIGMFEAIRGSIGSPGAALRIVATLAELIINIGLSIVVSIYLIADARRINAIVMRLVPFERRDEVSEVSDEIHRTLGRYLRREMLLVGLVAAATFLGLEFIFHLRFSLTIAIATGFLEIVPFVGPVVAGTIAAFVALSQGGPPLLAGVVIFYIVLRQIEDQLVSPVVLGNAVQLHPIVVIFSVLVGNALFGALGALLAIPVAASIKVVLDYWPKLFPRAPAPPPAADPATE